MAITYEHKPIDWDNEGIEPTQDLIEQGWKPGYKPPAEYFNAILNRTAAAITEIQSKTADLSVDFEAFTIDSGITDGTCTYSEDTGYTVTADSAVQSADYFCIRFKAPNDYVSGAKFTIGTTAYTAVNAGFKANDVVMLNFDRAQAKCFAVGGAPEVNGFSNVVVGSTTIAADSPTDTLTLVAGDNITLTPDATNDKVTISAAGSTVTVDSELSATSTNPVQNKVVTASLNKKVEFTDTSHQVINIGDQNTIANACYSIICGRQNSIAISSDVESNQLFGGFIAVGDQNTLTNMGIGVVAGINCTVGLETALQNPCSAFGDTLIANSYNFVIGKCNKTPTASSLAGTTGDLFVVGNGLSSSRTNAFRVAADGDVYGTKAYTASGADICHAIEWEDGNPDNEDRRGLFVTLNGDKLRIANAKDSYILGVVSATPSLVCNANTDDWAKKWKTDVFGERLLDENGAWILSEDFKGDENENYVSRLDRKEWATVGHSGIVITRDDGSCNVNGYCMPNDKGEATNADTGYRVMRRIDPTHIEIFVSAPMIITK